MIVLLLLARSTFAKLVPFYRYVAAVPNYHFYTDDPTEIGTTTINATGNAGYRYEGVACLIHSPGDPQPVDTVPLYRYVSLSSDDHFYTTNWEEIDLKPPNIAAGPWRMEKVAGYVYLTRELDTVPLHRYVHPVNYVHLYTTNICEVNTLVLGATGKGGFKYEGIAGYVFLAPPLKSVLNAC
ncbi:unnamed protein product [Adineta steineri]|uniref:DUF5648 domain-containing protein n=1 Tax=Adineta steineri TaxID=433720 RepID=A0A818UU82_9BILA|nr:unnamed protein product [Adineta steineri]